MDAMELKVARIKAEIKQYEMAAALGICQARLNSIENGRSRLTPELENRFRQMLTRESRVGQRAVG